MEISGSFGLKIAEFLKHVIDAEIIWIEPQKNAVHPNSFLNSKHARNSAPLLSFSKISPQVSGKIICDVLLIVKVGGNRRFLALEQVIKKIFRQ